MRPANPVALAAVALAAPAPADAATQLVVRGAGFGHGVGMSQYGAYGFALQGRDYRHILGHYYTGTSLARLSSSPEVRVLLASGGTQQISGAVRAGERKLDPSRTYTVRAGGQGVVLKGGDVEVTASVLRVAGEGALRGAGGTWRGAFELRPAGGGGVQLVNAVSLEDYLRGVVAAESPASWPIEALRAQAVAARTYALTTTKGGNGFDHYRDTRSQVYGGVGAETGSTDLAVQTTSGQVVTYDGRPVTTYFFSTSGGRTEDVEHGFPGGTPQPWLRSVRDPFDRVSPKHRWKPRTLTAKQAAAKLRGLLKGSFRGIKVLQRGSSPRIVRAVVIGSKGRTETTGPVLRARFGLDDTWAYFTTVTTTKRLGPIGGAQAGGSPDARAADVRGVRRSVLTGTIQPATRGARVRLQARRDGRWRTVGRTTVGRGGVYHVTVPQTGTYRVLYGRDVPGPAVRVG